MCMDNVVERLKERAINTKDIGFQDAIALYEFGMENPFKFPPIPPTGMPLSSTRLQEEVKWLPMIMFACVRAKAASRPIF